MTLNNYQEAAMQTCMPSSENFSYMMLNLVGEVGEFASKVAKAIRKKECHVGGDTIPDFDQEDCEWRNQLYFNNCDDEDRITVELQKEAGDILWQLSGLCSVMGWTLEDVAQQNLDKLAARKEAGTIDGNGDGISGAERSK